MHINKLSFSVTHVSRFKVGLLRVGVRWLFFVMVLVFIAVFQTRMTLFRWVFFWFLQGSVPSSGASPQIFLWPWGGSVSPSQRSYRKLQAYPAAQWIEAFFDRCIAPVFNMLQLKVWLSISVSISATFSHPGGVSGTLLVGRLPAGLMCHSSLSISLPCLLQEPQRSTS